MREHVCLTVLFGVCGANLLYAQESPSEIVFLHLKLQSNQVSLVSESVAPGRLKVFSDHHAALDMEVATSAGQVLWTNSVDDPSIRHLEYEDPDHPGQIISKEVQLTNAEFTVRIPVIRDAHHVNFYLSRLAMETNAADANPLAVQLPTSQRMDIGSVILLPTTK